MLRIFPTLNLASEELARDLVVAGRDAIRERGRFLLVLTGGRTCQELYRILAAEHRHSLPWDRVEFFWGDERCVGAEDAASNFGMARSLLLGPVRASPPRIHRIRGEVRPTALAAGEYARLIEQVVGTSSHRFDLVLLGMGADGHTASLYPGSPLLQEHTRLVAETLSPVGVPPYLRISLTLPALDSSREVAFLVSGKEKADALSKAMAAPPGGSPDLPASLVHPRGKTTWYADEGAAARVSGSSIRLEAH